MVLSEQEKFSPCFSFIVSSEVHLARKPRFTLALRLSRVCLHSPENANKFSLILQNFELLLVDVQGKEGRRQSKRQGKVLRRNYIKFFPANSQKMKASSKSKWGRAIVEKRFLHSIWKSWSTSGSKNFPWDISESLLDQYIYIIYLTATKKCSLRVMTCYSILHVLASLNQRSLDSVQPP